MKKDAYYFPHFCNARHDRKIKRVLKELGIEGYGIYFMVLEVLREQTDFRYPLNELDLLADEFGTSEQKVRVVVCSYNLFEVDEFNSFFSLKLIEFMQPYLKMKEQRSLAGKASAAKRLLQPFNDRSTTVQQSKVNESKVNESIGLIEKWFLEFPNSSQLELIGMNLNITKENLISRIPEFKKIAKVDYPNFNEFCNHFKNWVKKNPQTITLKIKELK